MLLRRGHTPDVLLDEGWLLVRRSVTLGETMNTTKTKKRQVITLPKEAMDVLAWHVETQLTSPEMQASDLLFPATTGGYRSPSVLNKPFGEIAGALGFPPFTQRGMRRTFNDLCRTAEVEDLVTRSISGHATVRMQHHYSTVNADEQRAALGKVIQLFGAGGPTSAASEPIPSGTSSGTQPNGGGTQNEKTG